MKSVPAGDRGRWIQAALGSGFVLAVVMALFREPMRTQSSSAAPKAPQAALGLRRVEATEAALLDPTPLFLPTRWNAAQKDVALPKVGGAFANFPARFAFEDSELRSLGPSRRVNTGPADLLRLDSPGAAILGIGRGDLVQAPDESRGAVVEITRLSGSAAVLVERLSGIALLETELWEPVEFVAVVDATGRCAPLVPTVRSQSDEIDSFLKKRITDAARIGSRLAPGSYKIRVGP